jgi:serine/threonine-protein kinase
VSPHPREPARDNGRTIFEALKDLRADLQQLIDSDWQHADGLLRRFIHHFDDGQQLSTVAAELLPRVDYAAWIEARIADAGIVAGGGALDWPHERPERVAIQLDLLRDVSRRERGIVIFSMPFFHGDYPARTYAFVRQIVLPFFNDLLRIVEEAGIAEDEPAGGEDLGPSITEGSNAPAVEKQVMVKVRLPRAAWCFDPQAQVGSPGGFGTVFRGTSEDGRPVAVKQLHVEAAEAAHRELRIAQELANLSLQQVMPILDSGQDAESERYYIVMPLAEASLQDALDARGAFEESEALAVLRQIAVGLQEVSAFVHRDLKPANILLWDGRWRIADFGIARFVEESTSLRTLRDKLSPPYAAPEQWRFEHPSHATDVYALGCIGYALLTGSPPFNGSHEEICAKHLSSPPPTLKVRDDRLAVVLGMMLRKAPESRPTLERVLRVLQSLAAHGPLRSQEPLSRLAAAAAAYEAERMVDEARQLEQDHAIQKRAKLARSAREALNDLFTELVDRITAAVPSARTQRDSGSRAVQVGPATLRLSGHESPHVLPESAFHRAKWDVVAGGTVAVEQASPRHRRSACLWYARTSRATDYRWLEVGYGSNPLSSRRFEFEPVCVGAEDADSAHGPAMDVVVVVYGPCSIDDEDREDFLGRWTHIFAEAAGARLQRLTRSHPRGG